MDTSILYIKDRQLLKAESINEINSDGKIIYEVVRVINSRILFLEDHLGRFMNSVLLSGLKPTFSADEITSQLYLLINSIKTEVGNIKFYYCFSQNNTTNFIAHFIPHAYPTQDDYTNGILLTLYHANRTNPEIKEEHKSTREKIQQYIRSNNAYEALLVHSKGYITEGSKSNFFLIKNNALYTAPLKEVLGGITAKQLMRLCERLKIKITEQYIFSDELGHYDSAFITGTSPIILPVRAIDSIPFNVNNPLLRDLIIEFHSLIEKYITLARKI